jgi:hypothetical protein
MIGLLSIIVTTLTILVDPADSEDVDDPDVLNPDEI